MDDRMKALVTSLGNNCSFIITRKKDIPYFKYVKLMQVCHRVYRSSYILCGDTYNILYNPKTDTFNYPKIKEFCKNRGVV